MLTEVDCVRSGVRKPCLGASVTVLTFTLVRYVYIPYCTLVRVTVFN
jgi:hypothetical protein